MARQYVTRHRAMAQAVATYSPVTTPLDGSTASAFKASGVSRVVGALVSISKSVVDIASGGVTIGLRLSGTGLVGKHEFTVGGIISDTTSTGGAKVTPPFWIPLDIAYQGGTDLDCECAQNGVDPGTPEIDVTLVFE